MKTLFGFFIWIFTAPAFAEQNLFNVPSSEITKPGHVFFQEQINYANELAQTNSTFCYGLENDFEVGIDILNLDVSFTREAPPFSPLFVASFQKAIFSTDFFRLAFGSQLGTILLESRIKPAVFSYLNTVTTLGSSLAKLYLGGYFANSFYLNAEDTFQFMAGLEIPIFPNRVHLMADHLHGRHTFGVTVFGAVFFPRSDFAISGGIQVPNSGTSNSTAAVIELTWI